MVFVCCNFQPDFHLYNTATHYLEEYSRYFVESAKLNKFHMVFDVETSSPEL